MNQFVELRASPSKPSVKTGRPQPWPGGCCVAVGEGFPVPVGDGWIGRDPPLLPKGRVCGGGGATGMADAAGGVGGWSGVRLSRAVLDGEAVGDWPVGIVVGSG